MNKIEGIYIMTPKNRVEAILSFLSYGKKRRQEIIKYVATIEDRNKKDVEDAVDNALSNLLNEGKVEKASKGVYYRTDQGKNIIRPKPSADQDEVKHILTQLEHSLDILSEDIDTRTLDKKTKPELLEDLLEIEMYKKDILHTEENLHRFSDIFDTYTTRLIDRISIDDNQKGDFASIDDIIEYQLLFQLTSGLIMNAQNGQEHTELLPEIHSHIQTLSEYSRELPPELGLEVQAVARDIYPAIGREVFLKLIKESSYDKNILAEMAFYTYDVHNEINELFSDLEEVKANSVNQEEKDRIQDLIEYITNIYRNNVK